MPIIWWFITHCRIVEDDLSIPIQSETDQEEPETYISVQAFTAILGTLLLSQNGLVGGPARFAVVELLSRVRRADAKDRIVGGSLQASALPEHSDGQTVNREDDRGGTQQTSSTAAQNQDNEEDEDSYSPVGLFGSTERRLFEREMIHQVVIGMGRLDIMEEESTGVLEEDEDALAIPDTTALPTPHALPRAEYLQRDNDSYFPATSSISEAVSPEYNAQNVISPSPASEAALLPASVISPQTVSSSSSPASFLSTPSLTSTESSTPSSAEATLTPPTPLNSAPYSSLESSSEFISPLSPFSSPLTDESGQVRVVDDWTPLVTPAARPLSPRSSPLILNPRASSSSPRSISPRPPSPFLSPPQTTSPLPHAPIERSASPIPDIASPIPEHAPGLFSNPFEDGLSFHGSVRSIDDEVGRESSVDENQLNEEASVGRLSSMSLMAAVTASGKFEIFFAAIFLFGHMF